MPEITRCPGCRGQVTIPDDLKGIVKCPNCHETVCVVDTATGAKWTPPNPTPQWMKIFGWLFLGIGVLGFIASAHVAWPKGYVSGFEAYVPAIINGVINPLFFICVPLGLYWLSRCGVAGRFQGNNGSDHHEPEEDNERTEGTTEDHTPDKDAPTVNDRTKESPIIMIDWLGWIIVWAVIALMLLLAIFSQQD